MILGTTASAPHLSVTSRRFVLYQCSSRIPIPSPVVVTASHNRRRQFSSTRSVAATQNLKSVAVLGSFCTLRQCGGITGLSTAWYLSKFAPTVPVTLYEESPRLGGWINSKRVEYDGGSVLFEQGPRTLRPWSIAGIATIDMIRQLNLEDEISIIPKSSPAAKNRFIYYPDRLNKLPNSVISTILSLRLPVMRGVLGGIFTEVSRKRRSLDLPDESFGSFLSRRFSPNLAYNITSAVMHGIYAGDIDRLSVKTLFPKLWRDEAVHGSLLRGVTTRNKAQPYGDVALHAELKHDNRESMENMRGASVYFFKSGMETLSRALAAELTANPNITIKTSSPVQGIKYNLRNSSLPFDLGGDQHSHVISTLFAPVTNSLLPPVSRIDALSQIEAVTVLVVNLYFSTPNLLPVEGFGYLLPKSVPASANPHHALGVIFDSCGTPQPSESGTKVTVMLGGHYWKNRTSYPSDTEAVEMARDVLKMHLGVSEAPLATNVALNKDCIPQYTVGHDARIKRAKAALLRSFAGRLSVAGPSYGGVGLNDCVRSARSVVSGIIESDGKYTGLEGLGDELTWVNTG
ncbi:Protoporphyrinogen oxidase [Wilcoxina mikolae CBS 423.85]|nr:Protoporphyrinogen oxidase [Wilcoxina mikolae CBS 423.85]